MRILEDLQLDFDDVLILPKRSATASRKDVDLDKHYVGLHSNYPIHGIPIIAANMDSTGTFAMAKKLWKQNCLTALHKFYTIEQLDQFGEDFSFCGAFYTLGMRQEDVEKFEKISSKWHINRVCIDVANGYSETFVNFVKKFREKNPKRFLMVGNVCTPDMVSELILAGADCVKVGIGSGSNCTTRIVTGVGRPQLSTCIDCVDAAHGLGGLICSDGGCRRSDDVCKAFAAGVDFVMLGNGMLGGTDECDGEWEYENTRHLLGYWENGEWIPKPPPGAKKRYFISHGMSSEKAMKKYYGKKADYRAAEGKVSKIPYRGSASDVIEQILGGLRGCCSLIGAKRLKDLPKCATLVRVNRTHNTVFGE